MRRQTGAGAIAALALTCVFGVTLLLSLAAGAGVYRRVQDRVEENAGRRIGMSYVTAKVRSFDEAGAVRTGQFAGSDALYLLQDYDGVIYETILYVYDGWLMEQLCEEGWELGPESGQPVTEAQALEVEADGRLLTVTLTGPDGQREPASVYLRSEG